MQSFEPSHDEGRWGPLSVDGTPEGELISMADLVRFCVSQGGRFLQFEVNRVFHIVDLMDQLFLTVPGLPARLVDDQYLVRLPGLQPDNGRTLIHDVRGRRAYLRELSKCWQLCGSPHQLDEAILDMPLAQLHSGRGLQPAVLLTDALLELEWAGFDTQTLRSRVPAPSAPPATNLFQLVPPGDASAAAVGGVCAEQRTETPSRGKWSDSELDLVEAWLASYRRRKGDFRAHQAMIEAWPIPGIDPKRRPTMSRANARKQEERIATRAAEKAMAAPVCAAPRKLAAA